MARRSSGRPIMSVLRTLIAGVSTALGERATSFAYGRILQSRGRPLSVCHENLTKRGNARGD